MSRSDFGSLMYPFYKNVWLEKYQDPSESIDIIFGNVDSSSTMDENDLNMVGISYMTETDEADAVTYQNAAEGYKTNYTHKKYTAGMQTTREEFEDNVYLKKGKKEAYNLGRSAKLSPVRDAMSVLINAFSTSHLSYGDGLPLCSTVHTSIVGGSTMSNASASGVKLSDASLNVGEIALREQVDDRGLPVVNGDGKIQLVVPLALEKTAKILAETDDQPETAENGINVYKGKYIVVASRWLGAAQGGSDTAWYLVDPDTNALTFYWRAKPSFEQEDVFDTEVAKFKVRARWSRGWSDFRGVWGSKGNLATYAS